MGKEANLVTLGGMLSDLDRDELEAVAASFIERLTVAHEIGGVYTEGPVYELARMLERRGITVGRLNRAAGVGT